MSEVPSNTPKRQAIVERLRQRIDCFRKRHDSCQKRQPIVERLRQRTDCFRKRHDSCQKRQAIVERLTQRIDCFRKRHDSCQAQESRIFQTKILENKVKMNTKIRPEQINKLAKQEESGPESKTTAAANNTGLQVLYSLYKITF